MNEDVYELGFEGLHHFADKYHDKIYNRLPMLKNKRRKHDRHNSQSENFQDLEKDGGPSGSEDDEENAQNGAKQEYHPPSIEDEEARSNEKAQGRALPKATHEEESRRRGSLYDEDIRDYAYVPPTSRTYQPYRRDHYPPPNRDHPRYTPVDYHHAPTSEHSIYRSSSPTQDTSIGSHRRHSVANAKYPKHKGEHIDHEHALHEEGLASSVVGALVGGLVGNEIGKGDNWTAISGAVMGAISANALEKRYKENKTARKERERLERDNGGYEYDYYRRRSTGGY